MSQLLPEGIDHLADCPYTVHSAIITALRILEYETFPSEERPPRRIWLDGDKLKEHWERVEAVREEKYGATTTSSETVEDEGEWEENLAAVELITRG